MTAANKTKLGRRASSGRTAKQRPVTDTLDTRDGATDVATAHRLLHEIAMMKETVGDPRYLAFALAMVNDIDRDIAAITDVRQRSGAANALRVAQTEALRHLVKSVRHAAREAVPS